MINSEPLTVLDALEANAEQLSGVRIHQMFPSRERDYSACRVVREPPTYEPL
jgi:hypothetical protein